MLRGCFRLLFLPAKIALVVLAGVVLLGMVGVIPLDDDQDINIVDEDGTYDVARIVDGDTVKIKRHGTTTIRLLGIDTPETVDPHTPVECGGPEATTAATKLLDGQRITISFAAGLERKDKYGRTLAYITLPNGDDFGKIMLQQGHAHLFRGELHARTDIYRQARDEAKTHDRGLWGHCPQ